MWGKVERYRSLRLQQGAGDESPFFTKWLYDHRRLSTALPLASGAALGERLKGYLKALKERLPHLAINPQSYGNA